MIKLFCDVCGVEVQAADNQASAGWPYEVPVDPGNGGPPVTVELTVGVGVGGPGQGQVCKACAAKAGLGALQQFKARLGL